MRTDFQMPYLALILFLPWFAVLGVLFWLFPRTPRSRARRLFDAAALIVAFVLGFVGMRWGYANADVAADPIWKQVLACLVAYGAFLGVLAFAWPLRGALLRRTPA